MDEPSKPGVDRRSLTGAATGAAAALLVRQEPAAAQNAITLTKTLGETAIEGQGLLDAPPWKWPER
jgi:hypothetical protein